MSKVNDSLVKKKLIFCDLLEPKNVASGIECNFIITDIIFGEPWFDELAMQYFNFLSNRNRCGSVC